jgi:hypothetical protein
LSLATSSQASLGAMRTTSSGVQRSMRLLSGLCPPGRPFRSSWPGFGCCRRRNGRTRTTQVAGTRGRGDEVSRGVLLAALFHLPFTCLGLLCGRSSRVIGFLVAVVLTVFLRVRRAFAHAILSLSACRCGGRAQETPDRTQTAMCSFQTSLASDRYRRGGCRTWPDHVNASEREASSVQISQSRTRVRPPRRARSRIRSR